MKTTTQPILRLLAALFFLCLFAPVAAGQDNTTMLSNWQEHLGSVDKLANTNGGNGTSWTDAILIASAEELAYFAKQVNSSNDITYGDGGVIKHNDKDANAGGFKGYYFALSADIDLSAHFWTPIGILGFPFNGNFDGKGYCVKGLKVRQEHSTGSYDFVGLFGYAYDGTLRNLGVWLAEEGVCVDLSSESRNGYHAVKAGGIAGEAAYIFNCYVTGVGVVEAVGIKSDGWSINDSYAGGIVGYLGTSLSNCYATVGVKAGGTNVDIYAGGIAGYGSATSGKLSQTYATGAVEAAGGRINYAGGIYGGYWGGTFSNNLALNPKITGVEGNSGRIGGQESKSLSNNYAYPEILVNGQTVSGGTVDDVNGDSGVDLNNFGSVIAWGEGWDIGDGTNLPKLKMKVDDDTYESWNSSATVQPSLLASNYLSAFPLHIVSPTGGTLTVKDEDGKDVPNDTKIRPGTSLTLTYAENTNYRFSRYLFGSSADNLQALSGNTIKMPDADLWLSADFNYQDPTPPPPPPTVYYTVSLSSVEGAVTDPIAGSYEVESWSTFRFYLTLEPDYSESQPVVTTSRGETITPRTSDGAYLVKYVHTDVEIFIDGIVKNAPPVANEPIGAAAPEPEIWSEDACLCIRLPEGMPTSPVRIFTPEGRLLHAFRSTPGLNRRQLPTGIYIVQMGDTVRKVLIK